MRSRHVILAALAAVAGAVGTGPISPAAAAGPPAFVTGTGNGAAPHAKLFDGVGMEAGGFYGFNPAITTGVRVASGDVDGDLQPEVITATGPGTTSLVVVHELDGSITGSFSPYGSFTGGANVAAGDVDGDTKDEIITAADIGGAPHVVVWDFDGGVATQKFGWYTYDNDFGGGVSIAAADLVGSGRADVVTGEGPSGSSRVRVWDLGSGGPVVASEFPRMRRRSRVASTLAPVS